MRPCMARGSPEGSLAVVAAFGWSFTEYLRRTRAVGMAAGIALVRGLARRETGNLGNFWVDLLRSCLRILLPLSILFAVILVTLGGAEPARPAHHHHARRR